MVNYIGLTTALMAALAGLASATPLTGSLSPRAPAANCNDGLFYCGQSLLNKGNYEADIVASLQAAGQSTDQGHIHGSLFSCQGPDYIPFQMYCPDRGQSCVDAGTGKSDYCG